jgi:hypothetical protein
LAFRSEAQATWVADAGRGGSTGAHRLTETHSLPGSAPLVECSDLIVGALGGAPFERTTPTCYCSEDFKVFHVRTSMKSLALIFALFAVACGQHDASKTAKENDESETIEQKAARGRQKMTAQHQEAIASEIPKLPRSALPGAVTELCDQVPAEKLVDTARTRCAAAHLAMGRMWFSKGFPDEGKAALARARAEGAREADIAHINGMLPAAIEKSKKNDAANRAAAGALLRQAFGQRLRQQYLDNNLDIEVEVSGKQKDRMTLRFALFNAVWANKIKKGDLLDQMKQAGFKRLDMTDGYDYHVYWNID